MMEAPYYSKRVLTLEEVIAYTGFKKNYILELIRNRIIPHSKPTGKKLFFDREKIEAWLLQNPRKTVKETEEEASKRVASSPLPRKKK